MYLGELFILTKSVMAVHQEFWHLFDRMLPLAAAFFSGFHSGITKALQDENHQVSLTVSAHQKTLQNVRIC
jgi:hypothetical protein